MLAGYGVEMAKILLIAGYSIVVVSGAVLCDYDFAG